MTRIKPLLMGFGVFFLVIWAEGAFINPVIAPFFGFAGSILGALIVAFVGYWLYAFVVKKTGAEPEA